MCRKKLLGLQRNQIFNQGRLFSLVFFWRGEGAKRFGELCVPLKKSWLRPASDFILQTSDFRVDKVRTPDFWFLTAQTQCCMVRLRTSHFPLLTCDFRLSASDFLFPTSDFRLLCQARLVLNPDNLTGDFTWSKIAADDSRRTRLLTTWQGGHF